MKIKNIAAVALAAVFAASAFAAEKQPMDERPEKTERNRTQLIKENRKLKSELDSLKKEIEKYRMEIQYTDSIANEMMALYEETRRRALLASILKI